MAREFLERMTVVQPPGDDAASKFSLEALFHMPFVEAGAEDVDDRTTPALILPGIPALGGTMDHAVLAEVAWAISQKGAATLRINYRGIGASSPSSLRSLIEIDDVSEEEVAKRVSNASEDAAAALAHLVASIEHPAPTLVGYAFGAQVAAHLLLSTSIEIERAILIAPPLNVSAIDVPALAACGVPVDVIFSEAEAHASERNREALKSEGLWPRVIAGSDANFVRGLSALGQEVTLRGWSL